MERDFAGTKLRREEAKCACQGGRVPHGLSGTNPLYTVWINMRSRCSDPKTKSYPDYGGRGIQVCQEWKYDFRAFRLWALANGYSQGLEIDREANDGHYEPGNCRFVTPSVNCRNKRSNRHITFDGRTQLLIEWCEELGVPMKVMHNRLNTYGWDVERAFTTPHRSVKQAAIERCGRSN